MSNEEHLPGYSLDDDPHPPSSPPTESLTVEPEGPPEPTPNLGYTIIPSSTAPRDIAQPQPLLTQEHISASPEPEEQPPAVDEFADPKIAQLHAIFPDFDAAILYSVVDSVGEDQDRAIDALLSMSDPDHVPSTGAGAQPPASQPPVTTQTQLDEEFARQLLLEDEERYARDRLARQQQQQQQQHRQFPYAQRSTTAVTVPPPQQQQQQGRGSSPQSPPSQRERDTMADVQDQFSKLAESGKRTFSTLVSKVKAKVQEFDQSRNPQNTSPTSASAVSPPNSASSGLDRHAQQAYYAPRLDPGPRRAEPEGLPPAPASHTTATDDLIGAPSAANMNRSPSNPIDAGKIGLLPKRPVSLVDTQAQAQQQQLQQHEPSPAGSQLPDDSDEEELEYFENPFEEGGHS